MDLTVITPTRGRPDALSRCLDAFARQRHGLRAEHLVVADGPCPASARVVARGGGPMTRYAEATRADPSRGDGPGANARDVGLAAALGDYVCFWDDDNEYADHCLATLHAAAHGVDMGVCQCVHRGPLPEYRGAIGCRIPDRHDGEFIAGRVDTMCVCVRAAVARASSPWADGRGRGNDYRWIEGVRRAGAVVRFLPVVIGEHV